MVNKMSILAFILVVAFGATIVSATSNVGNVPIGFVHGIVLTVDGEDYYLDGPPDGPGGAKDIPGHYWFKSGPNQLWGFHYNTGPAGAPNWWSSDGGNGELLYIVQGTIDTWSSLKAKRYGMIGYVHYHELVRVSDGTKHPDKIVWLRHVARNTFTLDGGPHPELSHIVKPGIDYNFIPNGMTPYP